MRSCLALVLLCGLAGGCVSPAKVPVTILAMPPDTSAKAATAMTEGDRLFLKKDWAGAAQAYQAAAIQQPTLAEAHYNWAVSLDRMGNKAEAKKHYLEAANLAPGKKLLLARFTSTRIVPISRFSVPLSGTVGRLLVVRIRVAPAATQVEELRELGSKLQHAAVGVRGRRVVVAIDVGAGRCASRSCRVVPMENVSRFIAIRIGRSCPTVGAKRSVDKANLSIECISSTYTSFRMPSRALGLARRRGHG